MLGGSHPTVVFLLKALPLLSFSDAVKRFPWLRLVAKILMPKAVAKMEHDAKRHEDNTLQIVREYVYNDCLEKVHSEVD